MPNRLFDTLKTWAQGVNTSSSPDLLPPDASPRARNTVLTNIGENTARIAKRNGALTLNTTPVTGSPGIIGGFHFKKQSGNKYNLLVSDTGRLDILNSDNSLTTVSATAFTTGTFYPIFAVANDLCFIANSNGDMKKFDGTNLTNFGIVAPAAPTVVTAAGGSMTVGTFDVALTYFNSATGQESSLSQLTTITTTGGNQKLNVSWANPTGVDAQVTHVRVYIRQQSTQAYLFRAAAGATPAADVTWGGYAPATLSTVLDISDTQFTAFIIFAPTSTENNPPKSTFRYPVWHHSRIFMADSGNVYFSNIKNNAPFPESFDPQNIQPINPNDGDTIIGLVSAYGRLLIFKRFSLWAIIGTDPNSWIVSLISADHGLASMRSIVSADGVLYWWSTTLGPTAYDGTGIPVSIGKQFLANSLDPTVVNQTSLASVVGALDDSNQIVLWAIPPFGQLRNQTIIPFNYRLRRFVADAWYPFDVYSMWPVETVNNVKTLYLGGYKGQVFQWWAATNDGVPSGTTTHGTVTAATSTTITDSTAAFATTGGGLIERYVYVLASDRTTMQRRLITANTGTQLTISPAWDTVPNTTNTYVVGGIDFQFDTAWVTSEEPVTKKRFEFLVMEASSAESGVNLDVDIFVSNDLSQPKKTRTFSLGLGGAVYDATTSIYDTTKYAGAASTIYKRLRVGAVGRSWRARIRNCQADQSVNIYGILMQSVSMSLKH